jgi:hypothetical protein
MNDNTLKYIINNLLGDDLPEGHLERFQNRLRSELPIQRKLWNLQQYAIAASIAIFITGTLLLLVNSGNLFVQGPWLAGNSASLNETEIYLKNEINLRIQHLTEIGMVNEEVIAELSEDNDSFRRMRKDLQKNPGDVRLTSAVLESYQLKLEVLDNMIDKTR